MKKIILIVALFVVMGLVILGIAGGIVWYSLSTKPVSDNGTCGGIAGLLCPENYICYYPESADYPDATGQCIPEYVDTSINTDVCPTDGPFEARYDSDIRYCDCPEEYIKQSDVVGYETCYGDAECPIMEVECVAAAALTWQTFDSPLLEYSIQYPVTWSTWSGSEYYSDLQDAESDVDYFSLLSQDNAFDITPEQILVTIERDTKQPLVPGEADRQDFTDVITDSLANKLVSDVRDLIIDGLAAVQQVEQDPDNVIGEYGYTIVTYIDADSVVYTIQVTAASEEDYNAFAGTIETMITSFTLL